MKYSNEVAVETAFRDPGLNGSGFYCAGSAVDFHPADKDVVVGIQLYYRTVDTLLKPFDANIVDDKFGAPLRGCIHFDKGNCKKGGSECPVASVITIKKLRERLKFLQSLPSAKK